MDETKSMDGVHLTGRVALMLFPCSLAPQSHSFNNAVLQGAAEEPQESGRPDLWDVHQLHPFIMYILQARSPSLEAVSLLPCLAMRCVRIAGLGNGLNASGVKATRTVGCTSTTFYVWCNLTGGCVEHASCNSCNSLVMSSCQVHDTNRNFKIHPIKVFCLLIMFTLPKYL